MRSLPGSKRSEREVRGFGHRLQATGNRPLPTGNRPLLAGNRFLTRRRRDAKGKSQGDRRQELPRRGTKNHENNPVFLCLLVPSRGHGLDASAIDALTRIATAKPITDHRLPLTGNRPPATGNRPPPSVLRPPPSGSAFICRRFFRTGECPSVVNLSVHRFPEFMRSGFFEIAPIPDPSILPRATAQRRDAQTSGKASVVSNRGELCGVSPSPAARGGGRTGGILLRSSARRHPPSVHCPPATAHRQPISRATTPRRDVQASKRSRASLRPSRVGRSPLRGHKKAPARAGALETD